MGVPSARAQGPSPPPVAEAPPPTSTRLRPAGASPATLVRVQGRVRRRAAGQSRWRPVKQGTALQAGDWIRAARGAMARLRYWDGVEVTLEPDTVIEVLARAVPEDEALRLLLGEVLVEIRHSTGATPATSAATPFKVRTPRAVAGAEGTRFRIRVDDAGERVAVLEGVVQLEAEAGEAVRLGPEEQAVLARSGRLRGKQPLALPWALAGLGLRRRERREEPFFGELGRRRSARFLAVVDPRRDALANPARVRRLLRGEGFDLAEVAVSERQGKGEAYLDRDLAGTLQRGLRDVSEAGDSADLFSYRALDDGRWAGTLRVRRLNVRARERLLPGAPSPFAGGEVRREATLEGASVAGQIQRAWRVGRRTYGIGLLHEHADPDGLRIYQAPAGGAVGSERRASQVEEDQQVLTLGYSWDLSGREDLGIVLRLLERDVTRQESSAIRDGAMVAPARATLLDRDAWSLDGVWRRQVAPHRVVAARAFFEGGRARRRTRFGLDPTRPDPDSPASEDDLVFGLAVGLARRARADLVLAADLSWQRLDLTGELSRNGVPAGLTLDERETRTALHLGAMAQRGDWDLRCSLEVARVHGDRGLRPGPGVATLPPPSEFTRAWERQVQVTLGRWLGRRQRVEVEFDGREPEAPERVWRLRWIRGF